MLKTYCSPTVIAVLFSMSITTLSTPYLSLDLEIVAERYGGTFQVYLHQGIVEDTIALFLSRDLVRVGKFLAKRSIVSFRNTRMHMPACTFDCICPKRIVMQISSCW